MEGLGLREAALLRPRTHISRWLSWKSTLTCAPLSFLKADQSFESIMCGEAETCLSLSALQSLEERRLLPAPPTDEEQALRAAGARHDHHLHRHLEHGWVHMPPRLQAPPLGFCFAASSILACLPPTPSPETWVPILRQGVRETSPGILIPQVQLKWVTLLVETGKSEYMGEEALGHLPARGSLPRGFSPGRKNSLFDLGCQVY